MHVTHLALTDFRSYGSLELLLAPGVTTFTGANGQGKTNLVEAITYVSTLGSHRVAGDAPLVRRGAERAAVRCRVERGGRGALVELEIVPGRANRARLNRSAVARPRDVLGILSTVLFAPEDLALVKGDPGERRRFLDDLLVARTPRFVAVRSEYERVLKQRSALLKTAGAARRAGSAGDLRTLDVWDGQLAQHGAELLQARLALVEDLRPRVATAYAAVAGTDGGTDGGTGLAYRPSFPLPSPPSAGQPGRAALADAMLTELARVRGQEIIRGVTLVGPHRDDLELAINGLATRGYASHGESWSFALALRLASFELLTDDGREPVLLLDDVFAELDTSRRDRLAALIAPAEQVLITAAVDADVPAALAGARFAVEKGTVTRVD